MYNLYELRKKVIELKENGKQNSEIMKELHLSYSELRFILDNGGESSDS